MLEYIIGLLIVAAITGGLMFAIPAVIMNDVIFYFVIFVLAFIAGLPIAMAVSYYKDCPCKRAMKYEIAFAFLLAGIFSSLVLLLLLAWIFKCGAL